MVNDNNRAVRDAALKWLSDRQRSNAEIADKMAALVAETMLTTTNEIREQLRRKAWFENHVESRVEKKKRKWWQIF